MPKLLEAGQRIHDSEIRRITFSNPLIAELIILIYRMMEERQKQRDLLVKATAEDNMAQIVKYGAICSYLAYNPILDELKKQLWETLSGDEATKIANSDPFEGPQSYYEPIILSLQLLPRLSSYDTFNASHPKAFAAKKLGAKVV